MKKIIVFTNNERSINIIKELKKKYKIEIIILSKKFLPEKLFLKLKNFKKKILFFENSKNLVKKLNKEKPDFILCLGFPKKISKEIINIPKYCSINIHGGRVPHYLGGSPINWQIINGETKIYLSSIKMNKKIDGGPLILQKFFKINHNDNLDVVKSRANNLFPKLCIDSINHIIKKKPLTTFPNKQKKFWKQRSKKDSKILIKKNSKFEAHNIIRASSSKNYPAYVIFKGKKIYLYNSKFLQRDIDMGKKYKFKKGKLFLKFFDGILLINKFKIIKKRKKIKV